MAYQDIDGNDVDGNGRELYEPAAPAPQAEHAKLPIDRPCSACSSGDTKMEYHDHAAPFREAAPQAELGTCGIGGLNVPHTKAVCAHPDVWVALDMLRQISRVAHFRGRDKTLYQIWWPMSADIRPLAEQTDETEKEAIIRAIIARGSQAQAAIALRISYAKIRRLVRKYRLKMNIKSLRDQLPLKLPAQK